MTCWEIFYKTCTLRWILFFFLQFYFSDQQFYKSSFHFCFVAETNSSDSSTGRQPKEKEVSWITHEPLLHKASDTQGVPQSSACELNVEILCIYILNYNTHKERDGSCHICNIRRPPHLRGQNPRWSSHCLLTSQPDCPSITPPPSLLLL